MYFYQSLRKQWNKRLAHPITPLFLLCWRQFILVQRILVVPSPRYFSLKNPLDRKKAGKRKKIVLGDQNTCHTDLSLLFLEMGTLCYCWTTSYLHLFRSMVFIFYSYPLFLYFAFIEIFSYF